QHSTRATRTRPGPTRFGAWKTWSIGNNSRSTGWWRSRGASAAKARASSPCSAARPRSAAHSPAKLISSAWGLTACAISLSSLMAEPPNALHSGRHFPSPPAPTEWDHNNRSAAITAQQGGFFDRLFGRNSSGGIFSSPQEPMGGTFRTVCVRTCDGFYFPISYSTSPDRFRDDEQACQRMCPATEVALYTY